jgi:hypothetical protein
MALLFDAVTEEVDHGSAADIDSMTVGTVLFVFNPTAIGGNQHLFRKDGTNFSRLFIVTTGAIEFAKSRSGGTLVATSSSTPATAGVWQSAIATWDTAGANGDQHLYHGLFSGVIAELPYSQQVVSSGTHDDSSGNWVVGHRDNDTAAFGGRIALMMVWNRQLSLGEIRDQQRNPHVTSGCILMCHYGFNGTGAQPDWSGKGHTGTVTGATVADHAPFGDLWDDAADFEGLAGVSNFPTIAPHVPLGFDEEEWYGEVSSQLPQPHRNRLALLGCGS